MHTTMSTKNGTTIKRSCHRNRANVLSIRVELTLSVKVRLCHGIRSS